jgi:hypothetical protein
MERKKKVSLSLQMVLTGDTAAEEEEAGRRNTMSPVEHDWSAAGEAGEARFAEVGVLRGTGTEMVVEESDESF